MKKLLVGIILLVLCVMLWKGQAFSQLYTCSVAADTVNFGSYSPLGGSPVDAVGEVRVSCSLLGVISLLVSYEIRLSSGESGSYFPRRIYSGLYDLAYNLYTDSARTIIWGDGSGGTGYVSDGYLLGLFTVTRYYPVYGRLPAGQNVPTGTYSDVIIVTVDYY